MKSFTQRATLAIFAAAAVLAACHGGSLPAVPQSQSETAQARPASSSIPACAVYSKLPGNYIIFTGVGNVKGNAFKGVTAKSPWYELAYTNASASPPPYPSPSPSVAEYEYYGTYTIQKHKTKGCVYLVTSKSGKPINQTYNADTFGTPFFKTPTANGSQPVAYGFVSSSLKLTTAGGSGTLTLTDNSGASYDNGTVKFTGRALLEP